MTLAEMFRAEMVYRLSTYLCFETIFTISLLDEILFVCIMYMKSIEFAERKIAFCDLTGFFSDTFLGATRRAQ